MNAVAETLERQETHADTRSMANALRMLAVDAVQQANSGHPGMPMGMAEIAVALWGRHLKHNPRNPDWPDRDRFVLSNGHGSMLLYGLLHLTGYDLPIDELKRFRQLHSKTPGHPEVGVTPGVETTTGPLGQGFANAVGMALAEALLAREFNRPGHEVVDHRTYAFVGDGCLMEGISHEAASLAGTLGLAKLTVLYDDNGISIDGHVAQWFADDTPARFAAYGWNVLRDVDGHDVDAIDRALHQARVSQRPTLICCKTVIGKGAPSMAGTHDVHGAPLGAKEAEATRKALDWPHAPFEIPASIRHLWDARDEGAAAEADWTQRFAVYREAYPEEAAEFERRARGALPARWREAALALVADANREAQSIATRKASQIAIEGLARALPELLGGSADLTGSNLTRWKDAVTVQRDEDSLQGNYIHFGVREFGMSAVLNGIALHRGHSAVRRHVPHLLRLLAQRIAHGRTDEDAHGVRLHARFDRPWRRRSDASVGRTCGNAALDSGARRLASLRYRRDRAGMGIRRRSGSSFVPVVEPSEPAVRHTQRPADRGDRTRWLRAARLAGCVGAA